MNKEQITNNMTAILMHLFNDGFITTKGAKELYKINNLKNYIYELRKLKFKIILISEPWKNTTNNIYLLTGIPWHNKKIERTIKRNARLTIDLFCY